MSHTGVLATSAPLLPVDTVTPGSWLFLSPSSTPVKALVLHLPLIIQVYRLQVPIQQTPPLHLQVFILFFPSSTSPSTLVIYQFLNTQIHQLPVYHPHQMSWPSFIIFSPLKGYFTYLLFYLPHLHLCSFYILYERDNKEEYRTRNTHIHYGALVLLIPTGIASMNLYMPVL